MVHLIELRYDEGIILVEADISEQEVEEVGGDRAIRKVEAAFGRISEAITVIGRELLTAIGALSTDAVVPAKASLELGLRFTAGGDLFVVKAATDASLIVRLEWTAATR